jgi:hypothetical protein
MQLSASLSCSPDVVGSGEFVTLAMGVPHGGDLSATDPSGTYYFLVRGGQSLTGSIKTGSDFAILERIELEVEGAMATPYVHGDPLASLLFDQSGMYRFRLSENLETDDGTPYGECIVEYRP